MNSPSGNASDAKLVIDQRLAALGLTIPPAPKPIGSYVPGVRCGTLVFTSGQLPMSQGVLTHAGKVGSDHTVEQGQAAARQCVLNALGIAADLAGGIERIVRVVRLTCYVNSAPGFVEQPKVANGASDTLTAILGDAGRHSRCAVGVAELPINAAVEIDLIVEVLP